MHQEFVESAEAALVVTVAMTTWHRRIHGNAQHEENLILHSCLTSPSTQALNGHFSLTYPSLGPPWCDTLTQTGSLTCTFIVKTVGRQGSDSPHMLQFLPRGSLLSVCLCVCVSGPSHQPSSSVPPPSQDFTSPLPRKKTLIVATQLLLLLPSPLPPPSVRNERHDHHPRSLSLSGPFAEEQKIR